MREFGGIHQDPTSTLIHGVEIISKKLGYCLNPMSKMYQFDTKKPYSPRPMTLLVASLILSCLIGLFTIDYFEISGALLPENRSNVLKLATESVFFVRLFKFSEVVRIITYSSIILVCLYHHGTIANVMAQNNNIVSDEEQAHIARISFSIFLFKVICSCITFATITMCLELVSPQKNLFGTFITFTVSLSSQAPLIFICYLATALGKHIENFSQLHVDTLFDQYDEDNENGNNNNKLSSSLLSSSNTNRNGNGNGINNRIDKVNSRKHNNCCLKYFFCYNNCCCYYLSGCFGVLERFFYNFSLLIKNLWNFLNYKKYPELPEMKMTKISSKIKLNDSMRAKNSHLIRIRLRKTQIMLSELRDTVSDINKLSSPIIMLKLLQETSLVVLIATGSIQAKAYRTISIALIPTIAQTICLITGIIYVCNCLDYTTSELKLMINKLFDFIIMNHRVDNNKNNNDTINLNGNLQKKTQSTYLYDKEDEALSETWSQFQYTRKLANTIQFTIGGILIASRRLVLPILGHIVSAVFIAIEIMSIIDTSKDSSSKVSNSGINNNHEVINVSPNLQAYIHNYKNH